MKKNEKLEWICTDDDCAQYCLKHSENVFELIQYTVTEDDRILISLSFIDLRDYMKETDEIQEILKSYGYRSMDHLREIYKENANQIIAECIFETYALESVVAIAESKETAIKGIKEYMSFEKKGNKKMTRCTCKKNEDGLMLNREDGTSLQLSEAESRKIAEFIHRQDLKQQLIAELNEVKKIHPEGYFVYSDEILKDDGLIEEIIDAKLNDIKVLDPLISSAKEVLKKNKEKLNFILELTIHCPMIDYNLHCTLRGSSIESLKAKINDCIAWMCSDQNITGTCGIEILISKEEGDQLFYVDIDSGWFTINEEGKINYEL